MTFHNRSTAKSQGCAPSDPQPVGRKLTRVEFDVPDLRKEARARVAAAVDHLEHGLAGDVDLTDAIHHCRRLLAAAERLLGRAA